MIKHGVITLKDNRKLGYSYTGRYETSNEKPQNEILFLFHGTPGSRLTDLGVGSPFYCHNISVICPERPGYGMSTPKSERTIINWADDVEELANFWGFETFHVAGGSGGGPYALACGAKLKQRIKSVHLISSIVPTSMPGFYKKMAWGNRISFILAKCAPFILKTAFKSYAKAAIKTPNAILEKISKTVRGNDKRIMDTISSSHYARKSMILHLQEAFKQGYIGVYDDTILFSKPWNFDYSNLKSPVFLWHGIEDRLIPYKPVMEFSKTIKNVNCNFVEGEGHMLIDNIDIINNVALAINSKI